MYRMKETILRKKTSFLNLLIILLILIQAICFNTSTNLTISNKQYLYGASDFDKYASLAQREMKENGIFASLTLAQAALESELGKHAPGNNFFGIKANCSWSGPTTGNLSTTEFENGVQVSTSAKFRAYSSVDESFRDHSIWLLTCYKDRNGIAAATTIEEQIAALGSYATSPAYIASLINIINKYNLTKYDDGIELGKTGIIGKNNPLGNVNTSGTLVAKYDPNKYTGDITKGWIYERFNYKEIYGVTADPVNIEVNINENILEIFDRAKTTYFAMYGGNSGGTLGGIDAGPVAGWRQCDTKWGHIRLGSSSGSICKIGCAATSVAIQIARSGVPLSPQLNGNLNPGSFVELLNKHGGFTSFGEIIWEKASVAAPSFGNVKWEGLTGKGIDEKLNIVRRYLSQNKYIIAHVNGAQDKYTTNHWVAVTGASGSDIFIIDPSGRGTSLNNAYGLRYLDDLRIYTVG